MSGEIDEQVYLNAAQAYLDAWAAMGPPDCRKRDVALQETTRRQELRAVVESAYRAGLAAASAAEQPHTWQIPPEPGPEVTALRDRYRRRWNRMKGDCAPDTWQLDEKPYLGITITERWPRLFENGWPLVDASGENGDQHD